MEGPVHLAEESRFPTLEANLTHMPFQHRPTRFLLHAAFAAFFVVTGYLVLRPSPSISELPFIPDWLAAWADRNWDLRTAVPFFFLSLLWTLLAGRRPGRLVAGHLALAALLILTELAQILLPERHAGLPDILWGLAGLSAGALLGLLISQSQS